MLIKKLSRILAISVIAFVAVLLWNTKSSQADESSKLLNSAAIQKIYFFFCIYSYIINKN